MSALSGPFHLIALVLLVSGVTKLADPRPPVIAMRIARLPVPDRPAVGVALGSTEVALGLAVFAVPTTLVATAVTAFYLALVVFVLVLRTQDASAGCGCFGASTVPPGRFHIVLNLASGAVAATAAVVGVPDIVDVLDEGVLVATPYAVLLAVGAGLVLLAPTLLGALDRVGSAPRTFGSVR